MLMQTGEVRRLMQTGEVRRLLVRIHTVNLEMAPCFKPNLQP
jgi:hypothetical protein